MGRARLFVAATIVTVVPATSPRRVVAGSGAPKNLLVIEAEDSSALDQSMKILVKGLGVKCSACHVKSKPELDDLPAKESTRRFMVAVVDEASERKRRAALRRLLDVLKIKAINDEASIWTAVGMWKLRPKKPDRRRSPG